MKEVHYYPQHLQISYIMIVYNIEGLIQISNLLEFSTLKDTCEDFLVADTTGAIDNHENCLSLFMLGQTYGLQKVIYICGHQEILQR